MNIWAYVLIGLQVLSIVTLPFMWGKTRGEYGWSSLIGNIIGLILLFLALGLKINISF